LSDHKFGAAGSGNKKKKYIIGGGILIALIVAVVVIVIVATGGSKDGGGGGGGDKPGPNPGPGPGPGPSPLPADFNPYNAENVVRKDNEISGLLKFAPKKKVNSEEEFLRGSTELIFYGNDTNGTGQTDITYAVETEGLGHGVNNEYIKEVNFTFGEFAEHSAFLSLADHNASSGRYSIPEHLVPKAGLDPKN